MSVSEERSFSLKRDDGGLFLASDVPSWIFAVMKTYLVVSLFQFSSTWHAGFVVVVVVAPV